MKLLVRQNPTGTQVTHLVVRVSGNVFRNASGNRGVDEVETPLFIVDRHHYPHMADIPYTPPLAEENQVSFLKVGERFHLPPFRNLGNGIGRQLVAEMPENIGGEVRTVELSGPSRPQFVRNAQKFSGIRDYLLGKRLRRNLLFFPFDSRLGGLFLRDRRPLFIGLFRLLFPFGRDGVRLQLPGVDGCGPPHRGAGTKEQQRPQNYEISSHFCKDTENICIFADMFNGGVLVLTA